MITLEDVTKIYDGTGMVALENVNIHIPTGDFVFVVGPSGAGKSTFMKMLFREELPTTGKIIVNGRNVVTMLPQEVPYLRRMLGIVFQDVRLLPNKTVYDNVAFAMKVVEAPHREIKRRVLNALELVGLRERLRNFPAELSGGEQQRVAIARAIVNNPVAVIADEPTGNLDPDTSWEIIQVFDRINRSGTTVVMATHDKMLVDNMKKRVIAIERARVVRDEEKGMYGYED